MLGDRRKVGVSIEKGIIEWMAIVPLGGFLWRRCRKSEGRRRSRTRLPMTSSPAKLSMCPNGYVVRQGLPLEIFYVSNVNLPCSSSPDVFNIQHGLPDLADP